MQRRFQLVRHVGGKFPAKLLGVFPLGDIKKQQRNAPDISAADDGACVKLILTACKAQLCLRTLPCFRLFKELLHLKGTVHRKNVLAHTAFVRIKNG